MLENVGIGLLDPRLHVVGHDRRRGVRDQADGPGDLVRGAVVQQSAQQRRIGPAWQQHRHIGIAVFVARLGDQHLRGPVDPPIRAVHHPQRGVEFEVVPTLSQLRGMGRVDHEVHRDQVVGPQSPAVAQRFDHREVNRVHEDEHLVPRVLHQIGAVGAEHLENGGLGSIFPVEPDQHEHQHREDDDHQPRALGELRHREDADHDRRQDPRGKVDRQAVSPARFPVRQMVFGHPVTGHRESGEHADRVKRDQRVDRAAGQRPATPPTAP